MNYEFQAGGPIYECSFPLEKDKENNIFFVRGKNDQGKTTSLDLIAIGLYATQNLKSNEEIISDALKSKIDFLTSNDIDKLKFNFVMESIDNKILIKSNYDKGDLTTEFNGLPVASEEMHKNIQVLYDVPDNPIVKLQSSIYLIKDNISRYLIYLNKYSNEIENNIQHIYEFERKEEQLKKYKKELSEKEEQLKIQEQIKEEKNSELTELENIKKIFDINDILTEFNGLEEQNRVLKEKKTELKRQGIDGGTQKYKKAVQDFNEKRDNIKKILAQIIQYDPLLIGDSLKDLKKIRTTLLGLSTPIDITSKNIQKWEEKIDESIFNLESNPINNQNSEDEEKYELIEGLMSILKPHLTVKMKIPGTDQLIFDFYRELEKIKKEIHPMIEGKKNLSSLLLKTRELKVQINDLLIKRINIPEVDDKQVLEYRDIDKEIKEIEKRQNELNLELEKNEDIVTDIIEGNCDKILQNKSKLDDYNILNGEHDEAVTAIQSLNGNIINLKGRIEGYGELTEPNKYDINWLNNEYNICSNLIKKLNEWKRNLENVNFRKSDLGIAPNHSEEFFDALSEYFADILKVVYFEKKSWDVKKVDLLNNQYIVENRAPIKFPQIGTGHTALNSIRSSINQKFGGKKKVILIDDISQMDEDNIQTLVGDIKKQIISGETLFALITIADNTVSEIKWEPVAI
ncbi:AAA family ATPase [Methanolacinia paynteri]|uniref:AAA family ATPase n=1 Tax=Methanolacinia paynteri TaxID=230356 RepID=UPI001470121E|nr:AAA family ATPase [Methanolacinia paynteri]